LENNINKKIDENININKYKINGKKEIVNIQKKKYLTDLLIIQ
jgi:hypothetical protein